MRFLFQTLKGHVGSVTALGVDTKGRTLFTSGADCFIRFWDIKSGRLIRVTYVMFCIYLNIFILKNTGEYKWFYAT